ncbi:unnamed protein product, partial [Symbiodinium sp. CCMP2456]
FGLSTTVANERLVEQIEAVVGEFLELVKVVTWRARLSFLQTQEGAIAPLVVLALVVFAVLTGDTWLVGEASVEHLDDLKTNPFASAECS